MKPKEVGFAVTREIIPFQMSLVGYVPVPLDELHSSKENRKEMLSRPQFGKWQPIPFVIWNRRTLAQKHNRI